MGRRGAAWLDADGLWVAPLEDGGASLGAFELASSEATCTSSDASPVASSDGTIFFTTGTTDEQRLVACA